MKVDSKSFISYAGLNLDRWKSLIGIPIVHPTLGAGTIKFIDIIQNDISIYIQMDNSTNGYCRIFGLQVLDLIAELDLPNLEATRILATNTQSRIYGNNRTDPTENNQPTLSMSQTLRPIDISKMVTRPLALRADPLFRLNQEVCQKTSPQKMGKISGIRWIEPKGYTYTVFYSAAETPNISELDLIEWKPAVAWGSLNDLLCDLAMLKLNKPQSDSLYALYSSRTKFEVYQFKPAVKFLSNPDQRLLIADEVGLGKTIEAGIIYLELQARLGLDQVLIICPSSLKQKWQDEMKSRFDEVFDIMDTKLVNKFLDDYSQHGDSLRLRGIVPLETIRQKSIAEKFSDIKLDLVIIDEAHHCRNTSTLANAVASALVENADAALLLTATPLQMGKEDLYNLLSILSPGEFDDFDAFIDRLEPNQFINRAASLLASGNTKLALVELHHVEHTAEAKRFLGNPYYKEIIRLLSSENIRPQEMVTAQRRLLELNTLSSIFTRTRKRDILENAPIRTAQTLPVVFTDNERAFYNKVIDEALEDFESRNFSGFGRGWITIMKERQAASCISAVLRRRQREMSDTRIWQEDKVLEEEFSLSENENSDEVNEYTNNNLSEYEIQQKHRYFRVAPIEMSVDSKFNIFYSALQTILQEDISTKVIVFSYFRDTIDYLQERLKRLDIEVRAIHGGYAVPIRQSIIEQFRDQPEIRVLISSDVGSEGLDFQFCDTLFNYDLPWNPMKVEQRIGRIDRFGQASERIRIYNLVIEDTIEERILMRLYNRIEIFKQSIGDIEEILGQQIRELTQVVFSKRLTPEEEIKKAEEAGQNILKRKQEMEDFEQKKLQFLGQEAIFSTTINKTIDSGRFVSDVEVHALVDAYLLSNFPLTKMQKDISDDSYFIQANDDFINEIKAFIYRCCKNDPTGQQFLRIAKPGKEIPITFNSELAYQRKLLEFITPRHPLARSALEWWKKESVGIKRIFRLRLRSNTIILGEYIFFIFSIDINGIEQNSQLIPVTLSTNSGEINIELNKQMLRLAQTSSEPISMTSNNFDENMMNTFEDFAFQYISKETDALKQDLSKSNQSIINARLTAVEQSYISKVHCVEEKYKKVSDVRIKRMLASQLKNMEAKYKAKIDSIKENQNLEVTFSLLIQGFVEIVDSI